MARNESDKEDLIRDATAMVERAELECEGLEGLITIGFFRDGRCSVYFDQDPFYQFDSHGRLRRAWEAGFLYRSQLSTLARIDRQRSTDPAGEPTNVTLHRIDLPPAELEEFRQRMRIRVTALQQCVVADSFTVRRAVTVDGGLPHRTLPLLTQVLTHSTDFIASPAGPR